MTTTEWKTTPFAPDPSKPIREQFEAYIVQLQEQIVAAFESLDPAAPAFRRDAWLRPTGGSGRSCVFAVPDASSPAFAALSPAARAHARDTVLEKAGVNVSIVHGLLPPAAIKQMRADHAGIPYDPESGKSLPYTAQGLSLVVHPRNPRAPTVHMNYRYFEICEATPEDGRPPPRGEPVAWWFGGGADLTPSYLYPDDCAHFHSTLKTACDAHSAAFYPAFKRWCDEYFFIPHRGESRGVGGIFFDDLSSDAHKRIPSDDDDDDHAIARPRTPEALFAFARSAGDAFIPSYLPILARRVNEPATEKDRRWQLIRRGRYVEFNLVYDRGTKFGLNIPGARVESILMSLPEVARWEYMSDMGEEEGSEEAALLEVVRKPVEWV
ncbi:Coproporphyrinogen oxidase [Punctularia strigosozonata HHB-11173 SS5]|uniref:Coproporphyrinogen oxidase n=1 Tax=Punctularia strigosozonata (strain HHB-11173) TaxID=741275 RepID=UPI0004417034|nr:Coproporphyrinogen oxidase [Punctularia strigosozonata HHB-11173 SS5]EIN12182.1 Coproporphyrinogen oxidase [Punctularia strigosozonata HHB-11173 SS5]